MSRAATVSTAVRSMTTSTTTKSINPKELFVGDDLSVRYAKFRPKLPLEHVKTMVELRGRKPSLWLDVGCGPGTSTVQMLGYADKIIGVDVSETQLAVARQNLQDPSLSFIQGTSEKLPVEDSSVDVITVVQAVHYFDIPAFFKEVDRVLKPGGVLGLASINTPKCIDSQTMDQAKERVVKSIVHSHGIPDSVQLLENNYRDVIMPYPPSRQDHSADVLTSWSLSDHIDLCMTFSPVNNFMMESNMDLEGMRQHFVGMMQEAGMTEEDEKSVYTWNQPCALVTAVKPL